MSKDGAKRKPLDPGTIPESDDAAIEAVSEQSQSPNGIFKLSSGVVMKAKKVPLGLLMKVSNRYQRPKPPIEFDPGSGIEFENPDHPDYKERVSEYDQKLAGAMMNVLILAGMDVESVPKGVEKISSKGWLELLEATGERTKPDNKHWRRLNWFLIVAAPEQSDIEMVMEEVGRLSGISEKDVDNVANFPRNS